MIIGDHELHPGQAAGFKRQQEVALAGAAVDWEGRRQVLSVALAGKKVWRRA